jgi:hypothetical protein
MRFGFQIWEFLHPPNRLLLQSVGTLRTGYPRVQASSQDNGSRLPARGSSRAATCPRGSGSCLPLGAALGPPRVPVALAPASRLRTAPGPPRITWAPAPIFWLRAAPELPRVPRMGSTGCKQINKYPLSTRPS